MDSSRLASGVGASELADSRAAGHAAATAAVAQLGDATPTLVVVYASVRYDFADMLDGIRAVTGSVPLVGASSSGHFHGATLAHPGEGVMVLVLGPGPYRFGVAAATGLREDAFAVGREVARAARAAAGSERLAHAAVLLLSDGLGSRQQALLSGVHRVAGALVPVAGGAAGDDRRMERTSVFHDGEALSDAAVAVWIDSPHRLDVEVAHGWRPVSLPLLVTRVDGPVVYEIGGRPALDALRAHFPAGVEVEHALRYTPVDGWPRAWALGLIEPDGTELLRAAYLDDEGRINTFAPLPPYSAIQIMTCEPDDLLDVADSIAADAVTGHEAGVLLVFSCIARLDILRERGPEEPARLQAAAGDVPTFGFFTYGEYARTNSVAGYHNATVAAIAL